MKNKRNYGRGVGAFILTFLVLGLAAPQAHAKSAVAGDIIVLGSVERSGRKLVNDTSVFEGDWIRTAKDSGGVLRIGQSRVEIGESSEMEVVRQTPLRIALKSGSIAFNFPKDTAFEIVTPQLEVRPDTGEGNFSGIVTARPEKEDRVQSRNGRFTILERQKNGAANHIMPEQILVAALFLDPPQRPLGGPQIAVIDRREREERGDRPALDDLEIIIDQAPFDVLGAVEVRFDPLTQLREPHDLRVR